MKKTYAILWLFVCLFAVSARAQDSGAASTGKTIAFEIKIIDADTRTLEAVELIAKDPGKLTQMIAEGKAKLTASTKVQVLSGELAMVRIGQRVPVQTAAFPAFQPPRNE